MKRGVILSFLVRLQLSVYFSAIILSLHLVGLRVAMSEDKEALAVIHVAFLFRCWMGSKTAGWPSGGSYRQLHHKVSRL